MKQVERIALDIRLSCQPAIRATGDENIWDTPIEWLKDPTSVCHSLKIVQATVTESIRLETSIATLNIQLKAEKKAMT